MIFLVYSPTESWYTVMGKNFVISIYCEIIIVATIDFLCSLVFTGSEEYFIFVFFAESHEKSVKKFQHQNWGPKHNLMI